MFSLYGSTAGTPLAILGCPFNSDGGAALGHPPNGNGCANRQSVSHSSDDHEQVQTARIDYNIDEKNTTWYRFQADTGVQAAYTDPINPLFDSVSPQPLYSFASGYTHVFSSQLVNYFNPAFSWYESLFGPADFQKTLAAFPIVLQGSGANAPFTTLGGMDNTWVQGRRATRFFINDNLAWTSGAHELRFGTNTRIFRLNDYDFGAGSRSAGDLHDSAAVHLRRGFHRFQDISRRQLAALQFPESGSLRAGHLESNPKAHLDLRNPRHRQLESSQPARRGGAAIGIVRLDLARCKPAAERGHPDRTWKHLRFHAARDPAAQDRARLAGCAANGAEKRLRAVQRSACPAALSIWWAPIRRTRRPFKGGLLGTVGGTAIAPGVPGSAVDATAAANQLFTAGFPKGQLSCASPLSSPNTCLQPVAITAVPDGKLHAPYFMEWSLALERQIGNTINLRAQYVGTRAVNQPYTTQVNGYQTVCQGCFAPFPYGAPTDPRFGAVTQLNTGANSHYNGLQTTAEKRLGHGLQVQANYTWSRCIDTVSNGGFLPFSAGGILSPIPGDLSATAALAIMTCATTSLPATSTNSRSRCAAVSGCAERMAGVRDRLLAQRLAFLGPERALFRGWKRHREWQRGAVRQRRSRGAPVRAQSDSRRHPARYDPVAEPECLRFSGRSKHRRLRRRRYPSELPVWQSGTQCSARPRFHLERPLPHEMVHSERTS